MMKWQLLLMLFVVFTNIARAEQPLTTDIEQYPAISIIIDDLGMRYDRGEQVVLLPGPIACSFLPHSPNTRKLALLAHSHNKEVMLHLPMQSIHDRPLGPGGLSLNMTEQQFIQALQEDLESVPHVAGINNHMGSLLTRHPGHMLWLMQTMNKNGQLFFVDSRTTSETVAQKVALENGVPAMQRDIFLDHDKDIDSIRSAFLNMIKRAHRKGTALAIGHPYKNTLKVLEEMLPQLEKFKVRLVSVSDMIKLKKQRKHKWQASLYPSPKAAKN